jgi:hypothetical protein
MKTKTVVSVGLLLFVATSILVPILRGMTKGSDNGSGIPAPVQPEALMVCYFRANVRCVACRTLEACSREVVEKQFAADAVAGTIGWQAVDYQSPGNEHLLADFRLITGGVVLVEFRKGHPQRWKALPETWNMTGDRTALARYLEAAITRFRRDGT